MTRTKEEILQTTMKLLKDINFPHNQDPGIEVSFEPDRKIVTQDGSVTTIAAWVATFIQDYKGAFDNDYIFITIADETGTPLFIQNEHLIIEIDTDTEGNYYEKSRNM